MCASVLQGPRYQRVRAFLRTRGLSPVDPGVPPGPLPHWRVWPGMTPSGGFMGSVQEGVTTVTLNMRSLVIQQKISDETS